MTLKYSPFLLYFKVFFFFYLDNRITGFGVFILHRHIFSALLWWNADRATTHGGLIFSLISLRSARITLNLQSSAISFSSTHRSLLSANMFWNQNALSLIILDTFPDGFKKRFNVWTNLRGKNKCRVYSMKQIKTCCFVFFFIFNI